MIDCDENDSNVLIDEDGDLCMPRIRHTSRTHIALIGKLIIVSDL